MRLFVPDLFGWGKADGDMGERRGESKGRLVRKGVRPHLRGAAAGAFPDTPTRRESPNMASLYAVTVPVFANMLGNLDHLLGKAAASGIDEKALIEGRLAEDMLPLTKQVQIACDTAKFAAKRIADVDAPSMADDETTIAQLRERIARTVAYLNSVDAAAFEGREDATVVLKVRDKDMPFTALTYATNFALPNFYFHVATAYAILRMKGVAIGKMDYLAGANAPA
jgi:hypothetical protein